MKARICSRRPVIALRVGVGLGAQSFPTPGQGRRNPSSHPSTTISRPLPHPRWSHEYEVDLSLCSLSLENPTGKAAARQTEAFFYSPTRLSPSEDSFPPAPLAAAQSPQPALSLRCLHQLPGRPNSPAWAHEPGQGREHPRPVIESPTNNFLQAYLSSVSAQRNRGL